MPYTEVVHALRAHRARHLMHFTCSQCSNTPKDDKLLHPIPILNEATLPKFLLQCHVEFWAKSYPPPPLQTPGLARDGLPGGGGRRSPSDGLPGGGGDCKGISRQTMVPSTNST